jgi:hypothetical protein
MSEVVSCDLIGAKRWQAKGNRFGSPLSWIQISEMFWCFCSCTHIDVNEVSS